MNYTKFENCKIVMLPSVTETNILYNKRSNSFSIREEEGKIYQNDGKVPGASFWSIEKARNSWFLPQNLYCIDPSPIKESELIEGKSKLIWGYPAFGTIHTYYKNGEVGELIERGRSDEYRLILNTTDSELIKQGNAPMLWDSVQLYVKLGPNVNYQCGTSNIIPEGRLGKCSRFFFNLFKKK